MTRGWAVAKARVAAGVGHDEQRIPLDRPVAEGAGAGRLRRHGAGAGLQPLPLGIDQGDVGRRDAEQALRRPAHGIELRLRIAVQDAQRVQGREALGLARRSRGHGRTFVSKASFPPPSIAPRAPSVPARDAAPAWCAMRRGRGRGKDGDAARNRAASNAQTIPSIM